MKFVRKITLSRWPDNFSSGDDIDANCLLDLKVDDNCLSIWKFDDETDVLYIASLISLNGDSEPSANTRLVVFESNSLQENDLEFNPTSPGNKTIVINVRNATHYDIQKLKISSIKKVADIIADNCSKGSILTFGKKEIIKVLARAYKNNEFDIERVKSPTLKDKIRHAANLI